LTQLNLFGTDSSLDRARKYVQANLEDGCECPCCGQNCKLYRRKLNSAMAAGLVWLVGEYGRTGQWVDIPNLAPRFLIKTGGQFSILVHWGLIEQKINEDTSKRCSGLWRPTPAGQGFVLRGSAVPRHVFLYNNTCDGFSDERTTVIEALSDRFDYAELMA